MSDPCPSRQLPSLPYCGLTIILSNPSRFDNDSGRLLSGFAGDVVQRSLRGCLLPACDIQLLSDENSFLPITKVVLLLGSPALSKYWLGDSSLSLHQLRGIPFESADNSLVFLASYLPQDAIDLKASYEKANNETYTEDSDGEGSENDGGEKSTKGRTSRKNFRFFLEQDITKACRVLQAARAGIPLFSLRQPAPCYRAYEDPEKLLSVMMRENNTEITLDIENDRQLNITVLSLSFNDEPDVWIIPLKRYNFTYAYSELSVAKLLRAIAWVFSRCTVVVHNGMHDLFVLAHRYHIPPPRRVYDTMLASSRIYPGVEKSLGHAGSLFTYEPYHKNEGDYNPTHNSAEEQLWQYNAKDVWLTKKVKATQVEVAKKLGATGSVEQINKSVYAYLLMSLTGIRFSPEPMAEHVAKNDRRMTQLLRVLKVLAGHDLLPTSNKQMVQYFHEEMGLKVVKRGKPTEKNPIGNPSLDEKALYKLYVTNDFPVIPVCLEYRRLQKESSMLQFQPWKE